MPAVGRLWPSDVDVGVDDDVDIDGNDDVDVDGNDYHTWPDIRAATFGANRDWERFL